MNAVLNETTEATPEPDAPDAPDAPDQGDEGDEEADAEPEPDAEPDAEPEAPEAPAVASGVSEQEMEKILEKIDRSATTFRNRVSDLLGEQAQDLSPCPLCSDGIMGHLFPYEWITPTNDTQARLLEVLRTPAEPEYVQAPYTRTCQVCNGWGKLLSGSKLADKTRITCKACHGTGFMGDEAPASNGAVDQTAALYDTPADEKPLAGGDNDIWGSPRILDDGQENPNYGKMPQYKNPTLP